MKTSFLMRLTFLLILVLVGVGNTSVVEAKSVSVSSNTSTYVWQLAAYNLPLLEILGADMSTYKQPMNSDLTPLSTTPPPGGAWWYYNMYIDYSGQSMYESDWYGLDSAYGTVAYKVKIFNNVTDVEIIDSATVPVGTVLRVERDVSTLGTDISWVGTGSLNDSPYGNWVANAGPLTRGCYASDFVGGWVNSYFLFNVNPPITSVTPLTSNINCSGNLCTVINTGATSVRYDFQSTNSKFYQRLESGGICYAINVPMAGLEYNGSLPLRTNFSLPIPAAAITFNLNAVAANAAPITPTITPAGGNDSLVNAPQSFSVFSTDPENDQLRYGIDWDGNDSVDQWVPSSGYVNSGTAQSVSRTWTSTGVKTFQALAQDNNGGNSGWKSHSVTIVNPTYSCTGALPTNASLCAADDTGLTANTPRTVANSCTVTKCEYTCNSGYLNSGGVCVPTQCNDGVDNDGDTFTDLTDPGCSDVNDNDESNPVPMANIDASVCTIPQGGNNCVSTVNWSSTYATVRSIRQDGIQFSTAPSNPGMARTVVYGSHDFTFYNNGDQLGVSTMNAQCIGGTSWDGDSCEVVALPEPNLVPSLPTVSDSSVTQGGVITLNTNNITNAGTTDAGPYSFGGFYIDNNNDGVAEYTVPIPNVTTNTAISGAQSRSVVWTVPTNAPAGSSYRISYIVDNPSTVVESDETDNFSGWSASFTVTVPASATLTGSGCNNIPIDGNTCEGTFTWNIVGAGDANLYNNTRNTSCYLSQSTGADLPCTLKQGNNLIEARDGNSVLRDITVFAGCIAGSAWNGMECKAVLPAPAIAITANPNVIRSGQTAPVVVNITARYTMSCTLIGVNLNPIHFTHSANVDEQVYEYTTRPLKSNQVVQVTCTADGITETREARIEVLGTIQEI